NSNVLTITNLQSSDAADYALSVSNVAGIATSATATLTVLIPAAIVTQPTNLTVLANSNASFTVTASGTAPLSYQWLLDGNLISGATNSSLTFAVQESDAGSYSVMVTNQVNSVTSSVAILTVLVPPTFVAQPVDATKAVAANASLSATVIGTAPFTYQWYFNG